MFRAYLLEGTTDASGDATIIGPDTLNGVLYMLDVDLSGCDATCDATISTYGAVGSRTLLTLTDSQAQAAYYPRHDSSTATGTANSANDVLPPVLGRPRVVVAQGGNAKSFSVTFVVLED